MFDQRDEDGVAVLLQEDPPSDLSAAVNEAVLLCPAVAITVEEESDSR